MIQNNKADKHELAFTELAKEIVKRKIKNQNDLNNLKNEIFKRHGLKKIPTNTEILIQ